MQELVAALESAAPEALMEGAERVLARLPEGVARRGRRELMRWEAERARAGWPVSETERARVWASSALLLWAEGGAGRPDPVGVLRRTLRRPPASAHCASPRSLLECRVPSAPL
jgi:hypothetical protein